MQRSTSPQSSEIKGSDNEKLTLYQISIRYCFLYLRSNWAMFGVRSNQLMDVEEGKLQLHLAHTMGFISLFTSAYE